MKLFSAVAGIALVFAAVFFLRYSMQQGWLQPPVRVLIGVAVALTLLALCELKAARRYPATANALDAAAIAILFATFFAAHSLWNLIPAAVTFGLLAVVTAVAVLLSIRRESLFIAVLGLIGGFATPALLSTGENRPIPLFAYLALLNIGLAWVAYRQVWPVLTVVTLVLTTIYQWIWVIRFLTAGDLPLALGIFALFPVLSVAALLLARRGLTRTGEPEDDAFERTAGAATVLPLVFVGYLAAVPAYGARPVLLFAFLLLIDVGLFAISVALKRGTPHALGALATLLVWAVWLALSYQPASRGTAIAFAAATALFYLFAPAVARWRGQLLRQPATEAVHAAPALLFVFAVIARIDAGAASPWPLFGPMLAIVLLGGWQAVALARGSIFYLAAFFAVAAQAAWSATHLTIDRLPAAVTIYLAFGIAHAAVPVLARNAGRPLRPAWAAGAVLLAGMGLLLFLTSGGVAPSALWALALLLAILNGGLFVENAASGLSRPAQAGSVLSWIVLAGWWLQAAGAVGVLPSVAVVTGLTLITFGGHAWALRHAPPASGGARASGGGLYLGLIGHLFLLLLATNRAWALPPWPIFGALAVITLATSLLSLAARRPALHAVGIGAGALVIAVWTEAASVMPWTLVGLAAAVVLAASTFLWMVAARRPGIASSSAHGAGAALVLTQATAIIASSASGPPPFPALLATHAGATAALLTLTHVARWPWVAGVSVLLSSLALVELQGHDLKTEWARLLILAAALYAIYTAYALAAGPRRRESREPWLVALASAGVTFFAAREAFAGADLSWIVGVIPVTLGFATAFLLRALLRLEPPGARDLTRLALVAGAALAFVTVAIPLQLDHQWVTIGWALEGAALAWLYTRVPHRGLLLACAALLATVFVRLTLNSSVWTYEPRSGMRILNWYLYTYLITAGSMFLASWYLARTEDRMAGERLRLSGLLPAAGVVLLFLLLNIEIADYYATGPEITFRFGVTVSQDLTYTIGWLGFGMVLLAAGIYLRNRPARVAAVALIAATTFKCFLYDLASLEGLYRVASFVGLAIALALVSLALQKFVLMRPEETA